MIYVSDGILMRFIFFLLYIFKHLHILNAYKLYQTKRKNKPLKLRQKNLENRIDEILNEKYKAYSINNQNNIIKQETIEYSLQDIHNYVNNVKDNNYYSVILYTIKIVQL